MSPSPIPLLSVVIAIDSDTTEHRAGVEHLAPCLDALYAQRTDALALEVIVPYHENVEGIDGLRARFAETIFLPVPDLDMSNHRGNGREHHDVLRARGLSAARGEVVALIEDHGWPDPNWCANTLAAHRDGYAAIGGAIENAIDRPLNWAVYFCDFGRYQNPLPPGESAFSSDVNTSYKRAALEAIRPAWEKTFREIVVHKALTSRGEKVALRPDIVVYQHRNGLRLWPAVRERFIWGRSYAATRNTVMGDPERLMRAALSLVLPAVLMTRVGYTAWTRRDKFGAYLRCVHIIALLFASWSLGEGVGYLMGLGSPGRDTTFVTPTAVGRQ